MCPTVWEIGLEFRIKDFSGVDLLPVLELKGYLR